MSELTKQLRIKAGMINLGERIEWGSETALMETAANRIDHLEAELAQLRAVPDDYLIVPIQPTEEMRKRAQDYLAAEGMIVSDWLVHTVYTEMLAAAPSAPATVQGVNAQLLEALEELMYACTDKAEALATAAIAAARKGEGK